MIKRISKAINKIPTPLRFLGYGVFTLLLMQFTKLPYSIHFEFMLVIQIAIYMYVSITHEDPEFTVSLFVDEIHIDKMKRSILPSVGDSIVIDCGNLVKVIDVNHDWSTPDLVQINCISFKGDKKQ